jgi:hypothetical protein
MKSTTEHRTMRAILAALKMRLYLSFGFGYSKLFPARDVVYIQADRNARRRATFIQRLLSRVLILATVGMFLSFFVAENEAGIIAVMYLLPLVILPIAVLLGAAVTTRVDSIEVCLRREYARLREDFAADLTSPGYAEPRKDVAERMRDYRANWYKETRKTLLRARRPRLVR